jgi:hypothetical protein
MSDNLGIGLGRGDLGLKLGWSVSFVTERLTCD